MHHRILAGLARALLCAVLLPAAASATTRARGSFREAVSILAPGVPNGSAVQVGSHATLNVSLEAWAQVTFQNGASQVSPTTAGFELGQSLYWGGITAMHRNGVNVTDFSAIGETSGLDWRQSMLPVPEPVSGLLMLAGLAAAGPWRRSRG